MSLKTVFCLPAAALFALAAPLATAAAVTPFSADYQATYMGVQANGRMTLAAAGAGRWTYSLNIRNKIAHLSQSTTFEERDGQWRPLASNDSSMFLIKRANKNANYDWGKGVATWTGDVKPDRAGPVRLQAGDMDAMLINLAIARDVAAGKPLNYRMVEDGRIKQLRYRVVGKESFSLQGKPRQATKVSRSDGDKETVVWVIDGLPAPARILHREKGKDSMDIQLKRIN